MLTPFLSWPELAGLLFLVAGLLYVRGELASAAPLEKLIALSPVFMGMANAAFGADHFLFAKFIAIGVPNWIPGHLFWAYFVGFALICVAVSMAAQRYVWLSATLFGAMLFLFVLFLHAPAVAANPRDRFLWAVALRDLAFGGGAWALAASWRSDRKGRLSNIQIVVGRVCISVASIFFGVEYFLYPRFVPGVPLNKLTPGWVPFIPFWDYLTGIVLIAAGVCIIVNKYARIAAVCLGLLLTLITLFLYLPILLMRPKDITEAMNYVADTLLFAGAVLGLARALPVSATDRQAATTAST